MLSVHSRVILVGLSKKPELNLEIARVVGNYDGVRYPVELEKTHKQILIRPQNISPIDIDTFLSLIEHLNDEIQYFCSLITHDEKTMRKILPNLQPLQSVIQWNTTAVQLGSDHICFYNNKRGCFDEDAKPYAVMPRMRKVCGMVQKLHLCH